MSDSYGNGYTSVQPWNTLPTGSAAQNGAYQRDVDASSAYQPIYQAPAMGAVSYAPSYSQAPVQTGVYTSGESEFLPIVFGLFMLAVIVGAALEYSDTAIIVGSGILATCCFRKVAVDFDFDETVSGLVCLAIIGLAGYVAYTRFNADKADRSITAAVLMARNLIIVAATVLVAGYFHVRDSLQSRRTWRLRSLPAAAASTLPIAMRRSSAFVEPPPAPGRLPAMMAAGAMFGRMTSSTRRCRQARRCAGRRV